MPCVRCAPLGRRGGGDGVIEIGNIRDYWDGEKMQLPEYAVYVGRRNNRRGLAASPLENRFPIGGWSFCDEVHRGTITREGAVKLFRAWLRGDIRGVRQLPVWDIAHRELDRLRALHEKHGKLTLVCWCAPKPCHAEVIKEVLEAGE